MFYIGTVPITFARCWNRRAKLFQNFARQRTVSLNILWRFSLVWKPVFGIRNRVKILGLQDPDRNYLYGSGSGSGSGSFYQQAKKFRKTLISTVLWRLNDLVSRSVVNIPTVRKKQKNSGKKTNFFGISKATDERAGSGSIILCKDREHWWKLPQTKKAIPYVSVSTNTIPVTDKPGFWPSSKEAKRFTHWDRKILTHASHQHTLILRFDRSRFD